MLGAGRSKSVLYWPCRECEFDQSPALESVRSHVKPRLQTLVIYVSDSVLITCLEPCSDDAPLR